MRSRPLHVFVLGVTIAAGIGCGKPVVTEDAAVDADAGAELPIDAPVDAPVDVPDPDPVSPAIDLTSAGGRMQGGNLTLDFAIGHGVDQRRASGGTFTLESGVALPP